MQRTTIINADEIIDDFFEVVGFDYVKEGSKFARQRGAIPLFSSDEVCDEFLNDDLYNVYTEIAEDTDLGHCDAWPILRDCPLIHFVDYQTWNHVSQENDHAIVAFCDPSDVSAIIDTFRSQLKAATIGK